MPDARGTMLQISMPVAPNGSGGAVFDAYGRLVGIATTSQGHGASVSLAIPATWIAQMRSRAPTQPPEQTAPGQPPEQPATAQPSGEPPPRNRRRSSVRYDAGGIDGSGRQQQQREEHAHREQQCIECLDG